MNLFRTVLILLLIYFGLRFFSRLLLPWLLKTFTRKVEKKMAEQMGQQGPRSDFKDEGGVYVKRAPKSTNKSTKDFDGGEYVDFEEVEE